MQTKISLQDMTTQELYKLIEDIQEELDERKWDELLARPVVEGTPMWEIQERAKADIRAGRVKEWKPGESFEALFQ
jgi:hypothetical protein